MSTKEEKILDLELKLWKCANGNPYAAGPGHAEQLVKLDRQRASQLARSMQEFHDSQMDDVMFRSSQMTRRQIEKAKQCADWAVGVRDWLVQYGAERP